MIAGKSHSIKYKINERQNLLMLSVICAIAGELGNLIRQPCSLPLCLHQSQKVETGIKMGGHRM